MLIPLLRLLQIPVHLIQVHRRKDIRNPHPDRTARHTVMTPRTGNLIRLRKNIAGLLNHLHLLLIEWLEIFHIRKIVFHLRNGTHA